MRSVRIAYHLGPPRGAVWQLCKTLIYTLLLMITIALTVTLMTVSDRLLAYAVVHFRLPVFVAVLWGKLRFPIIAVVGYFALLFLYAMAQDGRPIWRNIWPAPWRPWAHGWLFPGCMRGMWKTLRIIPCSTAPSEPLLCC